MIRRRRWAGCGHRNIVAPVDVARGCLRLRSGQPARAGLAIILSRWAGGLRSLGVGVEIALVVPEPQVICRSRTSGTLAPTFPDAKLRAAVSTPQSSSAGKIVRFGVFAVDLAAGELRKNGVRIRLQEQPFQVLAYLLEHPGKVVTREELRQKLWAADTFVDFDHSLNTAVNKLREALGDSASSPRFVETLARRGYRFLAPVEREQANEPAAESAQIATASAAVEPVAGLHRDSDVPSPHRGLIRALFGLIQIMYLCFYVAALFRLTEIDRVTSAFLPGWGSFAIFTAVLVTAGVGIPLRFYLLSAVAFDHQRIGEKFQHDIPGHPGYGPVVGHRPVSPG